MKLSDAIALGRTAVIPRAGVVLDEDGGGCALGMAGVAAGTYTVGKAAVSVHELKVAFAWALETEPVCPCSCPLMDLGYKASGIIGHLFDNHVFGRRDWTLDQLIDWVRSVEPPEQESQLPSAVGAQPDLGVEAIALPINEKAFERMEEDWHDSRANTR